MPEKFEFLILNAPERIRQRDGLFAVRLAAGAPLSPDAVCVIVAAAGRKRTKELLKQGRSHSQRVLLEVSTPEEAALAGELGFDGVVSRTPLDSPVPLWGSGGIGPHSAAAWYAGGAAGVVLDMEDRSWADLAQRFRAIPGIVHGLRESIRRHVELAKQHARLEPLTSAAPDAETIEGVSDSRIEALLRDGTRPVVFSGIPDARSAAMAAVLAAPL